MKKSLALLASALMFISVALAAPNTYTGNFIGNLSGATNYLGKVADTNITGTIIVTNGNVGIMQSPTYTLDIHSASSATIGLSGGAGGSTPYFFGEGIVGIANGGFSLYDLSTSKTRFAVTSSGNFMIGTNTDNNVNLLQVNGSAYYNGTITASGFASIAPHTPVAVTVGASPFSFTNTTLSCLKYRLSGSVAYSVKVDNVTVFGSLVGNIGDIIQPNEYITITYTVAPTCYTNTW